MLVIRFFYCISACFCLPCNPCRFPLEFLHFCCVCWECSLVVVIRQDLKEWLMYPGMHKFALKHWKLGLLEIYRDLNLGATVRVMRQYFPWLTTAHVSR